jgi:ANTAR domain
MMETDDRSTAGAGTSRRHVPERPADDDPGWASGRENGAWPRDGYHGRHSVSGTGEPPVARRTATGWRVGDEEVSDLTSAMVLADLLAADLPPEGPPTPGSPAPPPAHRAEPVDVRQLQETIAQLEHALAVRVRVEQAIGVLAERHRLRPRQAFELLRSAARARGRRVLEVAGEVVDSASNPLLRIPEELAKPPATRRRGRVSRRPHDEG